MNYTREQLEEQYRKLPEVLKNALLGVEVAERIYAIGTRAGFTMEEIGVVAEETGFIILGLDHPQKFIEKLNLRLKDRERARSVALEINEQIFVPLREALKSAHGMELKDAVENQKSSSLEPQRTTLPPPLRPTPPYSAPSTPPRPLPPPPPPPPSWIRAPERESRVPPIDLRNQRPPSPPPPPPSTPTPPVKNPYREPIE